MAPPKNPTNSDLLREIKEVKAMQLSQAKDIAAINRRHELIDVGKEAVAKYKQQQEKHDMERLARQETKTKTEVLKQVAPFIIALTALVYAIIQRWATK